MAVRRITRDELQKRLAPYKCGLVTAYPSGFELWETGWDEPFTLWSDGGYYDEWQYLASIP